MIQRVTDFDEPLRRSRRSRREDDGWPEPRGHGVRGDGPDDDDGRRARRSTRKGWPLWVKGLIGLVVLGFVGGLAALVFAAIMITRWSDGLPDVQVLAEYEPPVMTRVHAGDGRIIAEYSNESRVFVNVENIPTAIGSAFIAAEDKNFYTHTGVDFEGVARAQVRNVFNCLRGGCTKHGGSSITQQVAKNFFLTRDQTIKRKVQEMILARRLETVFTKDEILELYLNEIFLGRRAYGVAAASLLYFGKPLDELSLSEMAYLAALPKAPSSLDITHARNRPRAIARRNYVLDRMVANAFITRDAADVAAKETLIPADRLTGGRFAAAGFFVEQVRRQVFEMYGEEELYDGGLSIRTTLDTELQQSAKRALQRGLETYDRRHGYRGPVTQIGVGTDWPERLAEIDAPAGAPSEFALAVTLDLEGDAAVIGLLDGTRGRIPATPLDLIKDDNPLVTEHPEGAVDIEDTPLMWARAVLDDGTLGPDVATPSDVLSVGDVVLVEALTGADAAKDTYALRQVPEVNGAIMAMDPHTGRVLALVGGYYFKYGESEFNRAMQAQRQPGSAFKPFVYAAALDVGYTPGTTVLDGAYCSETGPDDERYCVDNYIAGRFYGEQTLRRGIEQSRNTMTVRLANDMGLNLMSRYGERFGIYDQLPPFEAMSLGAGETTVWRMTAAYAMLVNGGKRIAPTLLDRVQDRDGRTVFVHDARGCPGGCEVTDWSLAAPPVLPDTRERAVDEATAYQIVQMLIGVVERGTARALKVLGRPVAGKTGTTNDFKDGWFVGFSPDLVVGVYVGYDDPKTLGYNESGGRVAAPIFQAFMAEAMENEPVIPFRIPPSVVLTPIDANTGLRARPPRGVLAPYTTPSGCSVDPIMEAFKLGTEPEQYVCRGAADGRDRPFIEGGDQRQVVRANETLQERLARLRGQDPLIVGEEEDEDESLGGLF